MCKLLDLQALRMQTYAHLIGRIAAVAGVRSPLAVNLLEAPSVRALAAAGRLGPLECLIASATRQAAALGFLEAVRVMRTKERELKALASELAARQLPTVDVTVLDPDWGKKGRGAKITAWIVATGATAGQVADRFQLAISTAKRYIREARKAARLAA